jgi:SagB-type dehydrogenase family enzyme
MTEAPDVQFVQAPDVLLMWAPGRRRRILVRTWTGEIVECPPDSTYPTVIGFFHAPRTVRQLCESLVPGLPNARDAFDVLCTRGFIVPAEKHMPLGWSDPDVADCAVHLQAGWTPDPEEQGRQIHSRLREEPARMKSWPALPIVQLPEPTRLGLPLDLALARRRTHRTFSPSPLSAEQLSSLLGHAAGVNGYLPAEPFADVQARPYPSGGGRHPLEVYAVIRRAGEELPTGCYHWDGIGRLLRRLAEPSSAEKECVLFSDRRDYLSAPAWLFVSGLWERRAFKYEGTVMRNMLIECGALLQNLLLTATGLGLAGCPFDVRRSPMEDLFGLDALREPLLLGVAMGYPADVVHVSASPRKSVPRLGR